MGRAHFYSNARVQETEQDNQQNCGHEETINWLNVGRE